MKVPKTILFSLIVSLTLLSSCKKGCTDELANNYDADVKKDDGSCTYDPAAETESDITISFSHNFAGTDISSSDFDLLNYTNANGEVVSITKLQYSISDVRFYLASGDSILINGHHLIDLDDASSLSYTLPNTLIKDSYTVIAFNFGFSEADNISGAYVDLNAANWAWPDMLGGGYHEMKLEGRYIDLATDTISYQFHMGSKARQILGIDTTYHANYFLVNLAGSSFTLDSDAAEIEIKMDISEWFTNPNTWDLNTMFTMLMPNYSAQVIMRQNGSSTFSLGTITQ